MKSQVLGLFTLLNTALIAQQLPTGSPPSPNTNSQAGSAWYRGGNDNAFIGASNNLFGTRWNSPIYTTTFNVMRMKLNGSLNYTVNGYNETRSGYLLLGSNVAPNTNLYNNANFGAFSLLHLAGRDGSFVQEGGYRPWMKTGITLTDNNDLSYFGLRKVGTGTDLTETTISWTDNWGNAMPGPDDLVFRFLSGGTGNTNTDTDLMAVGDLDGLHVARFTPEGALCT